MSNMKTLEMLAEMTEETRERNECDPYMLHAMMRSEMNKYLGASMMLPMQSDEYAYAITMKTKCERWCDEAWERHMERMEANLSNTLENING